MIYQYGKRPGDDGYEGCVDVRERGESINLMWPASQLWQIGLSLLYQALIVRVFVWIKNLNPQLKQPSKHDNWFFLLLSFKK